MTMEASKSVAGSAVVSASLVAALVGSLVTKGILNDDDVKEIFEQALLMIEEQQAHASPDTVDLYAAARNVIEEHLRPVVGNIKK